MYKLLNFLHPSVTLPLVSITTLLSTFSHIPVSHALPLECESFYSLEFYMCLIFFLISMRKGNLDSYCGAYPECIEQCQQNAPLSMDKDFKLLWKPKQEKVICIIKVLNM